jgi:hypothetical protein
MSDDAKTVLADSSPRVMGRRRPWYWIWTTNCGVKKNLPAAGLYPDFELQLEGGEDPTVYPAPIGWMQIPASFITLATDEPS